MAQHQDFDAPTGSEAKPSGSFTLGGRAWHIRNRDDVPFDIVRQLMTNEEPAEDASKEEKAAAAKAVVLQTGPFFEATIVPEEVDDFMALFRDSRSPLTLGKLRDIMGFVAGVVFSEDGDERPTKPSSRKSAGRSTTGSTSEGSSSSRGTRQRASAG